MHAAGPWGRRRTDFGEANETLLDAVDGGLPALEAYAIQRYGSSYLRHADLHSLLKEARDELLYIDPRRVSDLSWDIEQLTAEIAGAVAA